MRRACRERPSTLLSIQPVQLRVCGFFSAISISRVQPVVEEDKGKRTDAMVLLAVDFGRWKSSEIIEHVVKAIELHQTCGLGIGEGPRARGTRFSAFASSACSEIS